MNGLTHAMVDAGKRLSWPQQVIVDKHSVGGLPGNRTQPIVVSIIAALGLVTPKTWLRAMTSPAGTADTRETIAPVDLQFSWNPALGASPKGVLSWGGGQEGR